MRAVAAPMPRPAPVIIMTLRDMGSLPFVFAAFMPWDGGLADTRAAGEHGANAP
jgi:hypothetical protein